MSRCIPAFTYLKKCSNAHTTSFSSYLCIQYRFNSQNRRGNGRTPLINNKRIRGVPADRGGAQIDDLVVAKMVLPSRVLLAGASEIVKGFNISSAGSTLDEFSRKPLVRQLAAENGISAKLFMPAYTSFRQYCFSDTGGVDPSLLAVFHEILMDDHEVDRLFPYFLAHAKKIFPHLEAMDDLRIISDLTQPHNWYPEARTIQRKIIFHAGPTNSGKTYHALKRFREAKSGVFCGPLKLLAAEVFQRSNELGLKCDMVTGEERRFAVDNHHPSAHLSSTVEMLSTQMRVEVAVIDEIQMLRDEQRGWAWSRALLGVAAEEVHLCGEPAAIDIVKKLLEPIGEHVEVRHYDRKTPLQISDYGLGTLDNIQPGDCIVCFSRKTIFALTKKLEKLGIKPAVIYGDLPPGTKLAQAAKFNDPNDPCNVLISTDAIGMGLNLNIKRVIFATCTRQGELLPNYSALQIAGRAGRYGTTYENGIATTLRKEDIGILKDILSQPVQPISSVGISPTFEQIETFSFHLPQASFVHLLDLFVSVCSISDHFFICTVSQMRELAELIDYIQLPLKVRYTFCISPLNVDNKLSATAFVKMARRFSTGQPLTYDWLMDLLNWPPQPPRNLNELVNLERVYEVMDAYLWLSLRFPDMLPDEELVRQSTKELDFMIQEGIDRLNDLLEDPMNAKQGSMIKKAKARVKTKIERSEIENELPGMKLPEKRRGKKKTIVESIMERTGLTEEEVKQLKEEFTKSRD
ncbi:unnamed protein product [Auanema sp. JU1783]|nr:unnamed protein product [Auanema sp. JU1783]